VEVRTKEIPRFTGGGKSNSERVAQFHACILTGPVSLLVLKVTLAPALVAAASLVERWKGHRAAGLVAGLPIVAGPILFLLALEQGAAFAAEAARQTLLGLVSLSAYAVVYGRVSRTASPLPTLAAAYAGFAVATLLVSPLSPGLLASLAIAGVSLTIARLLLPPSIATSVAGAPSLWIRMAAAATLVLTLTGLAHLLGPRWSGLLVPFPVAGTVLVVAAHHAAGGAGALRVLRGLLIGLYGFALFCTSVAALLPPHGIAIAFAVGVAAALAGQALALRLR
jgi:hypothetical protein